MYRIRNTKTGKYSLGGAGLYRESKYGKVWKKEADLKNHLTLVGSYGSKGFYKNHIIEELKVEVVGEILVSEYLRKNAK